MPKKSLGQNYLFDPSILRSIINAAGLEADDTVVEIGPGPGRMTHLLAERAKKLIAVEIDPYLYEKLLQEFRGSDNVEIVLGDVLEYRFDGLGPFKVVANIPYYITTPIIFRLIKARQDLVSMTLTIQREVAERIVAGPGSKDYGVLSIMVQYYAEPSIKFIVPKGAFRPVPKVDSAVIHLRMRKQPVVEVKDEPLFIRIVKTSFSQRRKTLANSLKSVSADIKELLSAAGIDPQRRPETLTIEEFARLSDMAADRQ